MVDTMNTKSFPLEIKSLDDESGIFEGYAAVFGNEDLGGDVIEPGAFKKTLTEQKSVPIFWNHEYKNDPSALPIGVHVEGMEDLHGLRVKGQINLETVKGREIYALAKQGAIKGLSIGYVAIKESWQGGVRRLKELKLGEYSFVTFPMNPLAQVTGVKSMDLFEKAFGVKAADFNATLTQALQKQELRQLRWKIEDALSSVISNLMSDAEMDTQTKIDTLAVSIDQYKSMMIAWMTRSLGILPAGEVGTMSANIDFAGKRQTLELASKTIAALLDGQEPEPSTPNGEEPQITVEGKGIETLLEEMNTFATRRAN